MSSAKLKGGDDLDDLDEIGDVSPDLKKGETIPIKAKGSGGGSTVIIEQKLDDISEEEDEDYEESYDDEEEEDATRESKEKSNKIIFLKLFQRLLSLPKMPVMDCHARRCSIILIKLIQGCLSETR